jgi:hypothetical protein
VALLHMLSEEEIAEDRIQEYFQDLYRVVCVESARTASTCQAEWFAPPTSLIGNSWFISLRTIRCLVKTSLKSTVW